VCDAADVASVVVGLSGRGGEGGVGTVAGAGLGLWITIWVGTEGDADVFSGKILFSRSSRK
jgi:hypothetical protein